MAGYEILHVLSGEVFARENLKNRGRIVKVRHAARKINLFVRDNGTSSLRFFPIEESEDSELREAFAAVELTQAAGEAIYAALFGEDS